MFYNYNAIKCNTEILGAKVNCWLRCHNTSQPTIVQLQKHSVYIIKMLQSQVLDDYVICTIFNYLAQAYINILSSAYNIDEYIKCINLNVNCIINCN